MEVPSTKSVCLPSRVNRWIRLFRYFPVSDGKNGISAAASIDDGSIAKFGIRTDKVKIPCPITMRNPFKGRSIAVSRGHNSASRTVVSAICVAYEHVSELLAEQAWK
jgi:hypothetical protein